MVWSQRIGSFVNLGNVIREFVGKEWGTISISKQANKQVEILEEAVHDSEACNPWFTRKNILQALDSILRYLDKGDLENWIQPYIRGFQNEENPRTVAVVLAGNIPAVGFHDFLCVLISGNRFLGKLSSDDKFLLPAFARILKEYDAAWAPFITFTSGQIHSFDSVIATGSNNSSGYFQYYFSKYPHIIRKNRNSLAVLSGEETPVEISALANDMVSYFGLGCRNVSRLFVPEGYDFSQLCLALSTHEELTASHKYMNNYNYYRTIFRMSGILFFDSGNTLLKEDPSIASPVSVVHYQNYRTWESLVEQLIVAESSVQCIVSIKEAPYRWCMPGVSQLPGLRDYADGVDTMKFLTGESSCQ
jgi:hypothetical protein